MDRRIVIDGAQETIHKTATDTQQWMSLKYEHWIMSNRKKEKNWKKQKGVHSKEQFILQG